MAAKRARKIRKAEPAHAVRAMVKSFPLSKTGSAIKIVCRSNEGLVGHMEIGQGSIVWWKAKAKKPSIIFSWPEFARVMEKLAERKAR